MPPKRAASKVATPLFADCVFAISGSTPTHSQSDIAAVLTAECGSTVATSVTKKVTHLITDSYELLKNSTKIQKAVSSGTVSLVTFDWVLDSIMQKRKLDETSYHVKSVATTSTFTLPATASSTSSSQPASDAAPSKKRRSSQLKDEDEEEEEVAVKNEVEKKLKTLKTKVDKKTAKASTSTTAAAGAIKQPKVDRCCALTGYEVYVDDECAWNARLNQTNIGQNNNKFYMIQLLSNKAGSYAVYCRWGRVGANGQILCDISLSLDGAKSLFEKKYSDKTRGKWAERDNFVKVPGKYHLLPPDDGDSDDEDEEDDVDSKKKKAKATVKEEDETPIPESKLDPKVQDLMKLIFNQTMMTNQMKELDYDADKMPLGKLAKATILSGYQVLKNIGEALTRTPISMHELTELSNDFYTVIPHSFGRHVPPVIKDAATLKKKLEMLESLGEIEIAQKLMKENKKLDEALKINPLDQQFASLNLNALEPMDRKSERFKLIEQFTKNSHGSTHQQYNLVIDEVFDLERSGEQDRFDSSGFSKFHNRRLLWHGSRLTNYVGILSQGLRIAPPEAPVTGYMFDKGAYFADVVSKSANYCFTSPHSNTGLMLLCEVALGDMFKLEQSDYYAKSHSEAAGKHSTKGLGLAYPDETGDVMIDDDVRVQAGLLTTEQKQGMGYRLAYNEYIVYNTSQIKMRYLIRMKFDYKRGW